MAEVDARVTGVALAGGASARFGRDKAFAELEGMTLVERSLRALGDVFSDVLLVVKDPSRYRFLARPGLRVVPDRFVETHSLGGIYSGLGHARTPYVFVLGCDMPLVSPALVKRIAMAVRGRDIAVPAHSGALQPLCAAYSRRLLAPIRAMIRRRRFRIRDLFREVPTCVIPGLAVRRSDRTGLSFFDVDRPGDLARIRRILRAR